jgi:hypothetical protein
MTVARTVHTATLLGDGKVLIAGGAGVSDAGVFLLARAELYDPEVGTFTATGNMTVARENCTATLLGNGKVLIAGGADSNGNLLKSAELYEPGTGTFTNMTTYRSGQTATLLGNGKVLIAGGGFLFYLENVSGNALASAELHDPVAGTFTATASMNVARQGQTATLLGDGKVLIAGGLGEADQLPYAELYDPSTVTFTATGSMTIARYGQTATLLPNGKVLVAGGWGGYVNTARLSSAELYE